ncbi:isopentenyl-diphosphate Delta-isomerase [Nereida sp. MMG025]|uniref:isopentenyl-diphosphate Delta-isomerase n=1 Tax=Nereida sp. MMG025 TaxID=2909981 RepID=UPI001F010249|nr:isopentenyl-diphosphate Delta-isomerase [Nereida sp. MMG025]MCF6446023.1 isopentenyl-diphosphate Delta-isomerase [Nereida sp. MMG025]
MDSMIPAWVDGVLTPVEKLEVHQRGLKHKAISVFLMKGTKVLLQQRAMVKYHTPGLWANTCCTHPDWNEDSADCAVRRLQEELGITDASVSFADQVEYRADVFQGLIEHEVVDVFVGHVDDTLNIDPNPAEVMDITWVEMDDLAADLESNTARYTPWLKIYMDEFRDRIFAKSL